MKRFVLDTDVFRIGEEEIDRLAKEAETGDPEACYKYGRVLYVLRYDADCIPTAEKLFCKAREGGVADASAALGVIWRNGDTGMADRHRARELFIEALDKDSIYASVEYLLDLIEGRFGATARPGMAISTLRRLMEVDDNPVWYYLMGRATEKESGLKASLPWYQKAVKGGVVEACSYLAMAATHDDEYQLQDDEGYVYMLLQGSDAGDCRSIYLASSALYDRFAASTEPIDEESLSEMIEMLEWCAELGYAPAAKLLGDTYYQGQCGLAMDYEKAWQWYAKGAVYNSAECYTMLYTMLCKGQNTEYGEEFRVQCPLCAARFGSLEMARETVRLYKQGRMTNFAREIETDYLPLFADEEVVN